MLHALLHLAAFSDGTGQSLEPRSYGRNAFRSCQWRGSSQETPDLHQSARPRQRCETCTLRSRWSKSEFLGWWPLWRLARCATWAHTLQGRQRLLAELTVYNLRPLPTPVLTGVRLLGRHLRLLWVVAAMPLLAFDQSTDGLPPVERRRVRVEHFRSSAIWDRRHARWVAVTSLAEATELWFEPTFGGAVEARTDHLPRVANLGSRALQRWDARHRHRSPADSTASRQERLHLRAPRRGGDVPGGWVRRRESAVARRSLQAADRWLQGRWTGWFGSSDGRKQKRCLRCSLRDVWENDRFADE